MCCTLYCDVIPSVTTGLTVTLRCVVLGKGEGETCSDMSDCSDNMQCVGDQTDSTLCSCALGFLANADRNCRTLPPASRIHQRLATCRT